MPDTRFTLLGKAVVMLVKATDAELRSILLKQGWKGIRKSKGRIKLKRKKSRKKATAKQLRARRLFAMRAKRGDFRR
jgi:hypothetical protein